MRNSIRLDGANCPHCFNEVLDRLASTEGVHEVHGSFEGPCIEIAHDLADLDVIFRTIRDGLHRVEYFSNEIQMMPTDITISVGECPGHT